MKSWVTVGGPHHACLVKVDREKLNPECTLDSTCNFLLAEEISGVLGLPDGFSPVRNGAIYVLSGDTLVYSSERTIAFIERKLSPFPWLIHVPSGDPCNPDSSELPPCPN